MLAHSWGGGGSIPLQTGHSAVLLEGPQDTVACPPKPESQEGAKQKPKRNDVAPKASLGHSYHGPQSKGPVPAQGGTDETRHTYQEVGPRSLAASSHPESGEGCALWSLKACVPSQPQKPCDMGDRLSFSVLPFLTCKMGMMREPRTNRAVFVGRWRPGPHTPSASETCLRRRSRLLGRAWPTLQAGARPTPVAALSPAPRTGPGTSEPIC